MTTVKELKQWLNQFKDEEKDISLSSINEFLEEDEEETETFIGNLDLMIELLICLMQPNVQQERTYFLNRHKVITSKQLDATINEINPYILAELMNQVMYDSRLEERRLPRPNDVKPQFARNIIHNYVYNTPYLQYREKELFEKFVADMVLARPRLK